MTINFTLVIQIINFIITYFLIRKILLKPAISIIKQENKIEENLIENIKQKEHQLQDKILEKNLFWQNSIKKFQNLKPKLEEIKKTEIFQVEQIQQIDKQDISKLEKNIIESIVNRVKHVES